MAKPAKPEHSAEFQIEIRNFSDYVGESRGSFFTKIPVYFHTERELDLPGDLFKFFFRLVYLAARQRTPGALRSTPLRLSRECYCHPESVLPYIQRLIQCQLIQEVGAASPARVEERRVEERREEKGPAMPANGFFSSKREKDEFRELYNAIPLDAKIVLNFQDISFESAVTLAAAEDRKYSNMHAMGLLWSRYPGPKAGSEEFAEKYWRLILHSPQSVIGMEKCITGYTHNAPKKKDGTLERNYGQLSSFLRGDLKQKWWSFLYGPGPGGMPKLVDSLAIRENDRDLKNLLADENIIYQIGQ